MNNLTVLLLYLVFFALSYGVELLIGVVLQFAKRPHFALILLLANLVTHPVFFFLIQTQSFYAQIVAMLVETGVFYGFYYYHYRFAKLKKTRKNKYVKCLLFDRSLMMSLAMNIGSYLTIWIPWTSVMQ